jgi:hypothetical protein
MDGNLHPTVTSYGGEIVSKSPQESDPSERIAQDAIERVVQNTEVDQRRADLLAPTHSGQIYGAGLAAI